MSQSIPRLDACRRELLFDHWQKVYTWSNFSDRHVELLAKHHNCTEKDVRTLMKEIAKSHPKPKSEASTDDTERPKLPTERPCEYCGASIVWMYGKACNPPILSGITGEGKVYTVRQLHSETCTAPNRTQGVGGHAAAAGG